MIDSHRLHPKSTLEMNCDRHVEGAIPIAGELEWLVSLCFDVHVSDTKIFVKPKSNFFDQIVDFSLIFLLETTHKSSPPMRVI